MEWQTLICISRKKIHLLRLKFQTLTFTIFTTTSGWTEGPTLNTARGGLSCGILNWKNPETDQFEAIAVAAGGPSDTVELLFFGRGDSPWVMGPSLPYAAGLSTMIEFQNSVILVGGGGGGDVQHLYQLSFPNGTWAEMKQTLKEPREGHVSFLVPDEIVNCH